MSEEKSFWTKLWDKLKWVLLGIAGAVLAILGIKKKSTEKQIKKNEEDINKIADTQEIIDEVIKQNDETINALRESSMEAISLTEALKNQKNKTNETINKNKEILEKYKK